MTKKNKLLSLIVCLAICFLSAFALMFTSQTALADVTLPTPPANAVAQISPKTLSTTQRYKTITTATATESDWIIFEWTNGASNTLGYNGGWGSMIGLSKTKLDLVYANTNVEVNASALFSTVCAGENVNKLVKMYFSTKTGEVYVTYNNGTPSLVYTIPASNRTYNDTDGVFASLRFNEFVDGTINVELANFKAYDAEGNNLGVESSFIFSAPTVNSSEMSGVSMQTVNNSRAVIKTTEIVDSEWVFFEWTNGVNTTKNAQLSGGQSLNFVAGKTANEILYIHENGATVINNTIYSPSNGYADILASGATVKVAFPMKDKASPVVYIKASGATDFVKQSTTYAINEFASQSGNINEEYLVGIWMNGLTDTLDGFTALNLKCYDEKGNAVEFDSYNYAKYVVVPEVDASDRAGISGVANNCSRTMIRTADHVNSDWVIFEWINKDTNENKETALSGGTGMWLLAGPTENSMVDPHGVTTEVANILYSSANGYSDILGAGNHVKIYFSMKDAANPIIYIKAPGETEFEKHATAYYPLNEETFANQGGNLNAGTHFVGIWMNGLYEKSENFAFTDLKCYDENGVSINVAFNLIDPETTTVTFKDGNSEYKKYTNAIPGNNLEQFNLADPVKANFIGWTKTEGGVDFVSAKDVIPATETTLYAKYGDSTASDLSAYAGLYKNAKAYFEITTDGKVQSFFAGVESGYYAIVSANGATYFRSNGSVGVLSGDTLTLNGMVYTKVGENYKTVSFYADGDLYLTVKVPTGMCAPATINYVKPAHEFNGWYLNNAKYNFAKPVTENVRLDAKVTLNLSPSTSYGAYDYTYYDAITDTMYLITSGANGNVYTKVVAGVVTTGIYQIAYETGDLSIEYLVLDGDADNPLKVTAGEIKGENNFFRLNDKYYITIENGDGTTKTLTVSADTYFKAVLPEEPVRDGYIFKGYKYSDGTAFDENSTIVCAITLYADWEIAVEYGSIPSGGGVGALTIVAIIVSSIILLGGVAFIVLYKKGLIIKK